MNFILSIFLVFLVVLLIPIIVYGLFSKFFGIKEPEKKLNFFISVVIQKIGTSIGFVWLFYFAKDYIETNWLLYALVWIVMFAIVEVGQAMAPSYSKKEAVAGIISEIIYFPFAAVLLSKLLT